MLLVSPPVMQTSLEMALKRWPLGSSQRAAARLLIASSERYHIEFSECGAHAKPELCSCFCSWLLSRCTSCLQSRRSNVRATHPIRIRILKRADFPYYCSPYSTISIRMMNTNTVKYLALNRRSGVQFERFERRNVHCPECLRSCRLRTHSSHFVRREIWCHSSGVCAALRGAARIQGTGAARVSGSRGSPPALLRRRAPGVSTFAVFIMRPVLRALVYI